MIRGHSFALFEIGRRLERAFGLSATLREPTCKVRGQVLTNSLCILCTLRKRIGRHLTPFLCV
jgi:uncharacterized alpha-E superfamily protein